MAEHLSCVRSDRYTQYNTLTHRDRRSEISTPQGAVQDVRSSIGDRTDGRSDLESSGDVNDLEKMVVEGQRE